MSGDLIHEAGTCRVITFSGAHSTGKSTLIKDLIASLDGGPHRVSSVPSCSNEWFRRRAAMGTKPACTTYDDVNRNGLRKELQAQLPGILNDLLLEAVEAAARMAVSEHPAIVLCDRWLTDVAAYSRHELGHEGSRDLLTAAERVYEQIFKDLNNTASYRGVNLYLTHVFIPVASCQHQLTRGEGPDGKPRATLDQIAWEENYHADCHRLASPGRTLVISSSDRLRRVAEVRARIGLG